MTEASCLIKNSGKYYFECLKFIFYILPKSFVEMFADSQFMRVLIGYYLIPALAIMCYMELWLGEDQINSLVGIYRAFGIFLMIGLPAFLFPFYLAFDKCYVTPAKNKF